MLNQPEARGCQVLVAGRNFGCGSSREHAPWALLDYGFRAVISTEIADIFRSNTLKNGLLPVVVDEATHGWLVANPGAEVEIDLPGARAAPARRPRGPCSRSRPFARYCLLNGVDELGYLLARPTRSPPTSGAARMKARIAVLGGDGIGPEVTAEAVRVLEAVARPLRARVRVRARR